VGGADQMLVANLGTSLKLTYAEFSII